MIVFSVTATHSGGAVTQVIAPLMGWVRNYHSYQFFDRTDGAAWGPEDSNAIDMMHLAMNGFDFLDDRKTRLAEVLQVHSSSASHLHLRLFSQRGSLLQP